MIISRTPYRISFLGGGTDYPSWYLENGGSVIAATIDKYCYLTCRYLPPFFEHRIRLVYSIIEECQSADQIRHPAVREVLQYLKFNRSLEIHHDGDLPARSGMGSSSSFTVGLLNALHALEGRMLSKQQLAMQGIHVEQERLRETVGSQDQVMASYGGLNQVHFLTSGEIEVRPVTVSQQRISQFNSHLMLFYTGVARTSSVIAKTYLSNVNEHATQMRDLRSLVEEGVKLLTSDKDIQGFGKLLHEGWKIKQNLGKKVSNDAIQQMYDGAMQAGALGGKLLGAGGGGFLLLFVPPEQQPKVREHLGHLLHVPFKFEFGGSQIIFYDPEIDYSTLEQDRARRNIVAFRESAEMDAESTFPKRTP